jgi:hypothetical protein
MAAWLSGRGIPVTAPEVVVDPGLLGGGEAWQGEVRVEPMTGGSLEADAAYLAGHRRYAWDAPAVQLLMHEELHQVRGVAGYAGWTQAQRDVEEGVVEAVQQDLARSFQVSLPGHAPKEWGYLRMAETSAVRYASAKATHTRWTSPAARAWRLRLLLADDAGRAALLAQA